MGKYKIKKLVSNVIDEAKFNDVDLVNSWGIVKINDTVWTSNNKSSTITSYKNTGKKIGVSIPVIGNPTGLVKNNSKGFVISNGTKTAACELITATEQGSLVGYTPLVDPGQSFIAVQNTTAVYTGLAI